MYGQHQAIDQGVRLDLGSATSVLEFWLRNIQSQDSDYKRKFIEKVTEAEVSSGACSCLSPLPSPRKSHTGFSS